MYKQVWTVKGDNKNYGNEIKAYILVQYTDIWRKRKYNKINKKKKKLQRPWQQQKRT